MTVSDKKNDVPNSKCPTSSERRSAVPLFPDDHAKPVRQGKKRDEEEKKQPPLLYPSSLSNSFGYRLGSGLNLQGLQGLQCLVRMDWTSEKGILICCKWNPAGYPLKKPRFTWVTSQMRFTRGFRRNMTAHKVERFREFQAVGVGRASRATRLTLSPLCEYAHGTSCLGPQHEQAGTGRRTHCGGEPQMISL